jgi:hypothetical protein
VLRNPPLSATAEGVAENPLRSDPDDRLPAGSSRPVPSSTPPVAGPQQVGGPATGVSTERGADSGTVGSGSPAPPQPPRQGPDVAAGRGWRPRLLRSGRHRRRSYRWGAALASLARRVVVVEILAAAVAGAALATLQGTAANVAVGAGGLALLIVLVVPWRGRPVVGWAWLGNRYRARRRVGRRHPIPVVESVLGGRMLREATDPSGRRGALLVDGTRWVSVSALHAAGPGPVGGAGVTRLPVGALWAAITESVRETAMLQIVVQRTVAPQGRPRWRIWLCLAVDTALAGDAIAARGGGGLGASRTVLVETARVGARAGLLGLRLEPLDATALRSNLAEVLAVPEWAPDAALEENWRHCSTADVAHRSYRQTRWVGSAALATVLGGALTESAECVTASLTLSRDDDDHLTVEPLLRVTAPADHLPEVDRQLTVVGATSGTRWVALDGGQLAGLRATVPMGCRA